jgi:hypothetical protein
MTKEVISGHYTSVHGQGCLSDNSSHSDIRRIKCAMWVCIYYHKTIQYLFYNVIYLKSKPGLKTRLLLAVLLVLSKRNSTKRNHSGNIQNQKYIYAINYTFADKDKFLRAIRKQLHINFGFGISLRFDVRWFHFT